MRRGRGDFRSEMKSTNQQETVLQNRTLLFGLLRSDRDLKPSCVIGQECEVCPRCVCVCVFLKGVQCMEKNGNLFIYSFIFTKFTSPLPFKKKNRVSVGNADRILLRKWQNFVWTCQRRCPELDTQTPVETRNPRENSPSR